jgi:glycosyl transferase family 2
MGLPGRSAPRLIGVARVKNEGDVIEEFVRYNLRFLDSLIVVDNLSFDGTRDILEALRREGLALTILDDPCFANRQAECLTRVAANLAPRSFDFLFPLDADEFIKAPDRGHLEAALAALPYGTHGSLPWTTYVPTRFDDAAAPVTLHRITHRHRAESVPFSKVVISRRGYRDKGATIGQGNHHAEYGERIDPGTRLEGVQLAHFPVRSARQLETKALIGWTAYLAMGYENETELGYQKRRIYEKLCVNPHFTEDDLYDVGLTYLDRNGTRGDADLVFDPLPMPEPIRYGDGSMPDLARASIALTRQMALALHEATEERASRRASDVGTGGVPRAVGGGR